MSGIEHPGWANNYPESRWDESIPGVLILRDGLGGVKWRSDCAYCARETSDFFPSHDAGSNCQSGRHNHCTCDSCF